VSELSNEFNTMWKTDPGWAYMPIHREGDLPTWRKACDLVTFFVTHKVEFQGKDIQSNRFEFSVELSGGGGTLLVHSFYSMSWETAQPRANEFIQSFFEAAFKNWHFEKKETSELCLKQVLSNLDGASLLAVGEDGRLYRATKTTKAEDGSLVQGWELIKSVVE